MEKGKEKMTGGSDRGFSLVEVIIVIAIMAVLVGIISIAVVPYLEKSREVKDLKELDNICRGLAVAVAHAGVQTSGGSGTFEVTDVTADETDPVMHGVYEQLGDCSGLRLVSAAGSPCKIMCRYDIYTTDAEVYADNGGGVPRCTYLKNSRGQAAELKVLSSGADSVSN